VSAAAEIIAQLAECTDLTELSAVALAVAGRIAALASNNGKGTDNGGLITTAQAAKLLNVSSSFLYSGEGKHISVVKVGRRKMYSRAVIERYIAQNSGNA
jgi:hypothetical protein